MANKNRQSRRKRARSNPRNYGELYRNRSSSDTVPAPSSQSETASGSESTTEQERQTNVDWGTEYAYVMKDLRQMALVSTLLFVAMVAVGFFI